MNILSNMKKDAQTTLMTALVLPAAAGPSASNGPASYIMGGIIALLIMGYLFYTLFRPDKF
jgi:K+-transporting ATPase KdpF subunit